MQSTSGWLFKGDGDIALIELNNYLCSQCGSDFADGMPILDLADLDEDNRHWVIGPNEMLSFALSRAIQRAKITGNIRLVWSSHLHLNALATAPFINHQNCQFIVIAQGSLAVLTSLYHRLMASPTFWPEIGDSSNEVSRPRIKIRRNFVEVADLGVAVIPNCPIRHTFAKILVAEALKFLLFHELTHIANGHSTPNSYLMEISTTIDNAPNIKRHTLEMDADSGAVVKLFNDLFPLFDATTKINMNIPQAEDINLIRKALGSGPKAVAKFTAVILGSFFSLLRAGHLSRQNMYYGNHPHAFLRVVMTFSTLENHIRRADPSFVTGEIGNMATTTLASILNELDLSEGTEDILRTVFMFFQEGITADYIRGLKMCWADLYPELNQRKLTGAKLAPPEVD